MSVTKKIFTRATANFFLINLNFVNKVYTYKTTLAELLFVEQQRVLAFIVRKEKKMLICTNKFVSGKAP